MQEFWQPGQLGGPIMEEGEQGSIVTLAEFSNNKRREEKTAAGAPTLVRTPNSQQKSYTSAPHWLTGTSIQ